MPVIHSSIFFRNYGESQPDNHRKSLYFEEITAAELVNMDYTDRASEKLKEKRKVRSSPALLYYLLVDFSFSVF